MIEIALNKAVKLLNKIPLSKNLYEGDFIYELGVNIILNCIDCNTKNTININYKSGKILEEIVSNEIVKKEDILNRKVAMESSKMYQYLGQYTVFPNLTALHSFFKCHSCNCKYLLVFGFGESQPGRNVCYISGIWKIEEI